MNLASSSSLLLSRDQQGGSVDVWKLTTSVCPDRQMAKGDGAQCKLCPLGRAGTGGLCPVCRPGTFAPEEGLDACEPCPLGTEMRDLGGVTCSACQVGTYAAELGTARCTACRRDGGTLRSHKKYHSYWAESLPKATKPLHRVKQSLGRLND